MTTTSTRTTHTTTHTHAATRSVLRAALVSRAADIGIDPDTIWCPSPHAVAAWRVDGGLLRLDIAHWSPTDLGR